MQIDKDHSGFIDIYELEEVLIKSNYKMSADEIQKIINEVDYAQNKKINYSEFIAATIKVGEFLTEERLQALFNQFDVDESNHITKQNIKDAFTKLGKEMSESEIN